MARSAAAKSAAGPVVVTGADGMLGQAFLAELGDRGIGFGRQACDVTDRDMVMALEACRPGAIVHCAANVNADLCQKEQAQCRRVQVEGTEHVIELAQACGAKLFYPQSFLIFDGSESPITEETPANPLSWYGRCKLDAAREIQKRHADHLIVQMGGFFGGGAIDKNFVGKLAPHLVGLIRKGERSIEIGDRVWQPTYTLDLARNSLSLIDGGKTGVYNMACHGSASFFELAEAVVAFLGISDRMKVVPVSAEKVQRAEAAERPVAAIMDNARLRAEGLDEQRPWREALRDYLNDDYFKNLVNTIDSA